MKQSALRLLLISTLLWRAVAFAPQVSQDAFKRLKTSLKSDFALHASNSNNDVNRRSLISLLGLGVLSPPPARASTVVKGPTYEQAIQNANPSVPLADLPMIRLRLPGAGIGRDFIAIQLKVENEGPFNFMVDSGLTTELITPHLQQSLGLGDKNSKANIVTGLGAGGATQGGQLVRLDTASLCCGTFPNQGQTELNLPPLYAVVTDFPQETIDPNHKVEGMLGMECLDYFDSDFDFAAGRFRLWAPGTAAAQAKKAGMIDIPAAVLNESGLLGIRVRTTQEAQPVIGIVDCGASFSAMNLKAAKILGLPTDNASYRNEPAVQTLGVDGRPTMMPTKQVQLTYASDPTKGPDGSLQFGPTPPQWKAWDPVRVGVYDLPIFSNLLGDGKTPYNGPAVLLGLDVLSQRRFILETSKTRARRIFMTPK
jgi:predicted aspartyl protease